MIIDTGSFKILTFHSLLLVTVAIAYWKGGAPERWGATVILGMLVVQIGGLAFVPRIYLAVDTVSVLVDLLSFLGFGAIALNARRIWPIWASSLQLLSSSAHFARLLEVDVEPMVYAVMKSAPTFLVLIILLMGTLLHWRRVHRKGFDPSWQTWRSRENRYAASARTSLPR